jgi:YjbE family integral membrane protein
MLVNLVLSGDNAVVIALAAHALPPKQQKQAIVLGSAAAILMRILLTVFALKLLTLPGLKIIGGIFLFYIAVKLIAHPRRPGHVAPHATIGGAVKTILIADMVMSLDNVLGVAAAAKGNLALLAAGLALSIPLIVFGSGFVLKLMRRFPGIVMLGAALLGYLGGDMLFADAALRTWTQAWLPGRDLALGTTDFALSLPGLAAALAVMLLGAWRAKRRNPA